MTANTAKDHQFKVNLLDDTLSVIDMEKLYIFVYLVWKAQRNKLEDLTSSTRLSCPRERKKGNNLFNKKSASWALLPTGRTT